ncbi:MAG: hypothetical protein AAF572_04650 [Cyanobacteria bacterium P01_B01_bin.77]
MKIDSADNIELFRWWQRYQTELLRREAEQVRNGLLQEVFIVRRQLELAYKSHNDTQSLNIQPYISKLEQIYTALEKLSDRLGSPYLRTSLPLALRHALQPWQSKLNLQSKLLDKWCVEPIELTQLLVAFINDLCRHLSLGTELPDRCEIQLQHQNNGKELTIHAFYNRSLPADLKNSEHSESLIYMLKIFQILTQGEYIKEYYSNQLIWILKWQE